MEEIWSVVECMDLVSNGGLANSKPNIPGL